jgi:hypothetical protein
VPSPLKPLNIPKMRFLIPGPLLLSLPPKHREDSISPYWGELESQPRSTVNAIGPPGRPTLPGQVSGSQAARPL